MHAPNTCFFDNKIPCLKTGEGRINIRERIEFILAPNDTIRNNGYYDNLPVTTKDFLRGLMEVGLSNFTEKPDCNVCVQCVDPVAISAVSLSIIRDYKEGSTDRELNVEELLAGLQGIDDTITPEKVDLLAPFRH